MASETLSLILTSDPELAFMPNLFGIYRLQGSFIMLIFVHRMPEVEGGRNESVERACEVIIRAHEISVATLSVEFQRDFRKIFRAALNRVKEHRPPEDATSPQLQNHTPSTMSSASPHAFVGANGKSTPWQSGGNSVQNSSSPDIWRNILRLYRWTNGTRGLAI